MTEITGISNIKFTRDTKVDYQKGNLLINILFRKFDTDGSGDFNDIEWDNYEKHLQKLEERKAKVEELKINDKVVNHYDKNILQIQKKIDDIKRQFEENENFSADFDRLIEFEDKHGVARLGYQNKDELPEGAFKYDVSSFEMGVWDDEKKCFTGKTYEKGYLEGFESLSKADKKEYLRLLDKAEKTIEKVQKLEEQLNKYNEELDKNFALKDMAKNGYINRLGSPDYERNAYERYRNIRNEANPYYKALKETEQKYAALASKPDRTKEENAALQQLRNEMNQLEAASKTWSISDRDENTQFELEETGFKITEAGERFTLTSSEESLNLNNTQSVGVSYSDARSNVSANFENTKKYNLKNSEFEDDFNIFLNGNYYAGGGLTLSGNSYLNTDDCVYFSQDFSARYKKFSLNVSEIVNTTKYEEYDEDGNVQNKKNTTTSTTIKGSHSIGHFENTASVLFAEEGTQYSAGSSANFGLKTSENTYLNINPSFSGTYNGKAETYNVNPRLATTLSYNNKDYHVTFMLSDDFNTQFENDSKPLNTNTFTGRLSGQYKKVSADLSYTNYSTPDSKMNTLDTSVRYTTKKAGTFSANYSLSKDKTTETGVSTKTNTVSVGWSAPITNWFKHKKDCN